MKCMLRLLYKNTESEQYLLTETLMTILFLHRDTTFTFVEDGE